MTAPDLYVAGKHLDLVKRIGRGGEGEVFLVAGGATKKAVKIYTGQRNAAREAKVKAMVRLGLAKASSLISFPQEIVLTRSGEFAGFTMKLVEGYRPIHELYGPKSRKTHYPKADYRFLVRAAANTARAVGQVHSSPCVIGDINHSGILVSTDATVALIDADSFQLQMGSKILPCLVGVPEFTPPELQARSLNGVVRTKIHDCFGLSVAIFQILFMGRHPYAGRQSGCELTLDQMIARNLFAYSRTRSVPVLPPGIAATLDDLPSDVASAFERAFGLDPSQRPTASEWVGLLKGLEKRLSQCASNEMHFYPSAAKNCPWCRMESASGAVLFAPSPIATVSGSFDLSVFDSDKAWATINAVVVPDPSYLTPMLPPLPTTPSPEAKMAKDGSGSNKIIGGMIAFAAICAFFAFPPGAILWLLAFGWACVIYNKTSFDEGPWRSKFMEVDQQWQHALEQWRKSLLILELSALKGDLGRAINEYKALGAGKSAALKRLESDRQSRQLHEYLDRFLIRRASIPSIGPARTATLASFGIESAADVTATAITKLPGFGNVTAAKLLAWRAGHEKRFTYNPAPLPSDALARAKLEGEFTAKAKALVRQISGGQTEIVQLSQNLQSRREKEDATLSIIAIRRNQLEVDLKFLGIKIP